MSHHSWGEKDFDWRGLDDAILFIHLRLTRAGFEVSSKEKWGNADIYAHLWDGTIFTAIPYSWRRLFPRALRMIDFRFGDFLRFVKILPLIHSLQNIWYCRVYDEALTKWPHIKEEIVGGICRWEEMKPIFVKHKLRAPYLPDRCHKGDHNYDKQGICEDCYLNLRAELLDAASRPTSRELSDK